MTHNSKISDGRLDAKQNGFLAGVFGDDFRSVNADDCIRAAWRDAFRLPVSMRYPFYSKNAPKDSVARNDLREFAKGKTMEIAEKVHERGEFVCDIKCAAADMLEQQGVDITHVGYILELQDAVTQAHGASMEGGKLKFGRAQKLLNMYLKYMWCANKIPKIPPHCPFDDIIINWRLPGREDPLWDELGGWDKLEKSPEHDNIWTWTQSDDVEHYLVWLAAAEKTRQRTCYGSLAEWELFVFSEEDCEEE